MRTRALFLVTFALASASLSAQTAPSAPSDSQAPSQTPAVASEGQAPAPAPAPAATQPSADKGPEVTIKDEAPAVSMAKAPASGGSHDTISVDFPDEEIRTILRSVADLFELNLVIPETLQGKTSVKLRDVSWRQIFQVVLAPVNYTYMEDGNIIKIVSNESLQQEPTKTEVFVLNYARAADIMPTVASLVEAAAGGKIVVDNRSNSMVITERPSRLGRIRPIIESLDRATDQVMIESKFIEVTAGDVKNLGVKWSSLDGVNLGAGNMQKTYADSTGRNGTNGSNSTSINNSGQNSSNTALQNSGSGLNSSVATTNGVTTNTSTATSNSSLSNTLSDTLSNSTSNVMSQLSGLTHTNGLSSVATAVFSASDFNVVLSALSTLNDTKIVSNPTIVTLNNTEALINVGEEYPIPNYTYNQERGTFEVSGFTYRPIGIILKVVPQVNSRGFVKLNIEPEVSQRNGETNFGGSGGASIPIIATRKAKTQVSLKDGYTMGIGGLIRKQDINKVTKVPVLGDIPYLGALFKHKSKDESATNLLIFITAKVVNAEGASLETLVDPRQIREMRLNQGDLPGYREKESALAPMPVTPPPAPKKTDAKASSTPTKNKK